MKIRPLGAELFHVDRRTNGHDEANSLFCNFAKALKIGHFSSFQLALHPYCQKIDIHSTFI
jgi:hypothetical protein